jgi:hypothetical protein
MDRINDPRQWLPEALREFEGQPSTGDRSVATARTRRTK